MGKIKITKEEAEKILKVKGRIRGLVLTTLKDYVVNQKGKEGIKKVEKRMEDLGHPFKFEELSSVKWYPAGLIQLAMLVILDTFGWDDKKNFEIGYQAPINSILAKLMLRTFTSLETAFKVTPKFWRNYTDLGEMNWVEHDMEKRKAVLRLTNYPKTNGASYEYFRGYLKRIMEIMTKSKNVEVKITKSIYRGDPYDDFTFTW